MSNADQSIRSRPVIEKKCEKSVMFVLSQAQEQVSRQEQRGTLRCGTARSTPWGSWCCRHPLMSVDPRDLQGQPGTCWCGLPSCSCLSLRVTGVDWRPSSPYPGTSSLQRQRQQVQVPTASSVPLGISFHPSQNSLAVTGGSDNRMITFTGLDGAGQSLLFREYISGRMEESPRPGSLTTHEISLRSVNRISSEPRMQLQTRTSSLTLSGFRAVTRLSEHISFVYSPSYSSTCLRSRTLLTILGSFGFDNLPLTCIQDYEF